MSVSRKEISFDLDTKALEKYFDNISNAYYGQGSVYNSVKPMSKVQLSDALYDICKQLPWLSDCTKSIDVTNIGKTHSLKTKVDMLCKDFNDYTDSKTRQNEIHRKRKCR